MEDIRLNISGDPAAIAQLPVAPALDPPLEGIDFLLDAIGFHNPAECLHLMEAGLANYEDFHYLIEKNIRDMAEEFSKWTVAQGCITFCLRCIKRLTGLMHWVQDCFHTNDDSDHMAFNKEVLTEAQSHAPVCKSDTDLVDVNTKVADPGKFKDEHKWPKWSKAFHNYLSVIPGISRIPLVYVIHEKELEEGWSTLSLLSQ